MMAQNSQLSINSLKTKTYFNDTLDTYFYLCEGKVKKKNKQKFSYLNTKQMLTIICVS